jgi:hypothetical protein
MSSCEKEYFEPAPPEPIDTSSTPDTASYSLEIQPYFDANCVSCHMAGATAPVLSAGVSYDALINGNYINTTTPASSNLYVKINVGSMKQYSTSAGNKDVLQWITEGAKNN